MSSISVAHQAAGLASPTADILVRSTWSGIRRANGVAQSAKTALLTDDIRAMVMTLPNTLLGRRDACLLLLGFASAVRRSELVALDVADVTETSDGLVMTITRSKTDQEGEGRQIGIPYGSTPTTCPVRTLPKLVAGHSLRSGMATSAARAGATEAQIMNQTGHKSLPVLRRYIRRGSLFHDNAAAKLGL